MLPKPDVIAAVATGHGVGGIGVVRVSGYNLINLAAAILGKQVLPRLAALSPFLDADGVPIDIGIALYFPAPHSYTGEDILELQGHGGPAVLQLVLQRCLELGARLAMPGEFTQRAFFNNKLDLAQAESVADLIGARTSQAARSAVRSLQGEFSQTIHHLVEGVVRLRVLVEAMLDFPEEGLDAQDILERNSQLGELSDKLDKVLGVAQQGSLLRDGAHIVLVGQPNVGKSSLLNRLSGEEVALVSEIPGTTRDVIRQAIQIGGVPLHIIDTAGLRESLDITELMGIARTRNMMQKADAILILFDAVHGISDEDKKIIDELPATIPRLYVFNKVDLLNQPPRKDMQRDVCKIYLSAKTGDGLDLLRDELLTMIGWHHEEGVYMARERHLHALFTARHHLSIAAQNAGQAELFAEELRHTQEALNSITGEFSADDLLGEIFSSFCIGK